MKKIIFYLSIMLSLIALPQMCLSVPSYPIYIQGMIKNWSFGEITVDFNFQLYDSASQPVTNGLIKQKVGINSQGYFETNLNYTIPDFKEQYYLGVSIFELLQEEKIKLTATPYSTKAKSAETFTSGKYLLKTGGTMTGILTIETNQLQGLNVEISSGSGNAIYATGAKIGAIGRGKTGVEGIGSVGGGSGVFGGTNKPGSYSGYFVGGKGVKIAGPLSIVTQGDVGLYTSLLPVTPFTNGIYATSFWDGAYFKGIGSGIGVIAKGRVGGKFISTTVDPNINFRSLYGYGVQGKGAIGIFGLGTGIGVRGISDKYGVFGWSNYNNQSTTQNEGAAVKGRAYAPLNSDRTGYIRNYSKAGSFRGGRGMTIQGLLKLKPVDSLPSADFFPAGTMCYWKSHGPCILLVGPHWNGSRYVYDGKKRWYGFSVWASWQNLKQPPGYAAPD